MAYDLQAKQRIRRFLQPRHRKVVVDAQRHHTTARHEQCHAPHAWRLWSYRWKPPRPGIHQLTVRATDSRGATQPRETVWNQSGYLYNAWHSANVEVRR